LARGVVGVLDLLAVIVFGASLDEGDLHASFYLALCLAIVALIAAALYFRARPASQKQRFT